MTAIDEIFGSDIKLDPDGQAVAAANGELILTRGGETGLQDVRLRLMMPLGSLFYDKDYGSLIHEWIREENTSLARMGFTAEVERRVKLDPRVDGGTVACSIRAWDAEGITAGLSFRFVDEDHVNNLVITAGDDVGVVVKDVNPV